MRAQVQFDFSGSNFAALGALSRLAFHEVFAQYLGETRVPYRLDLIRRTTAKNCSHAKQGKNALRPCEAQKCTAARVSALQNSAKYSREHGS